jgi:hypothetical protein
MYKLLRGSRQYIGYDMLYLEPHLRIRKEFLRKLSFGLSLGTTCILFLLFLFGFVVDELLLLLQDFEFLLVAGFLRINL